MALKEISNYVGRYRMNTIKATVHVAKGKREEIYFFFFINVFNYRV